MTLLLQALIAALLIALNAFFVLSEFALVTVRATRLEELSLKGNSRAKLAKKAVKNIDAYLSAIQLGITMASLALGWVGEPVAAKFIDLLLPGLSTHQSVLISYSASYIIAFAVITAIHVTLGEQVPKLIAIKAPESSALWTSVPITIFYHITFLPMTVLNKSANWVIAQLGFKPHMAEMIHSEDELRMILGQSQEQGKLSLGRLLMFENLFDFGHTTAKEIMTPRDSIAFLSATKTWQENMEVIRDKKFSRYPLCSKTLDDASGYVVVKDIIYTAACNPDGVDISAKKRGLITIGEDMPVEKLLREFQESGLHIALVRNTKGAVTGLITIEDVIEELVGEIRDEVEIRPPVRLSEVMVPSDGLMSLQQKDRFEALRSMLDALHAERPIFNKEEAWAAIEKREKLHTCALGHGTAFPHARLSTLAKPMVILGRSDTGVDFPAMDKQPVQIIFLILTPFYEPASQLRVLSELAKVVSNHTIKKRLLKAATAAEATEIIRAFENKVAL